MSDNSAPDTSPASASPVGAGTPTTSSPPTATASATTSTGATKPPWPNSADDYEMKEVIGVGATAVVHAAYCKTRDEVSENRVIYFIVGRACQIKIKLLRFCYLMDQNISIPYTE